MVEKRMYIVGGLLESNVSFSTTKDSSFVVNRVFFLFYNSLRKKDVLNESTKAMKPIQPKAETMNREAWLPCYLQEF